MAGSRARDEGLSPCEGEEEEEERTAVVAARRGRRTNALAVPPSLRGKEGNKTSKRMGSPFRYVRE